MIGLIARSAGSIAPPNVWKALVGTTLLRYLHNFGTYIALTTSDIFLIAVFHVFYTYFFELLPEGLSDLFQIWLV